MLKLSKRFQVLIFLVTISLLSGCMSRSVTHNSSSVVSFLYPDKQPVEEVSVPHLKLPLNVGIAFVPDNTYGNSFTEKDKQELLESVGAHFKLQSFVNEIKVIPSAYLRKTGGFDNLDQIRLMHNVDVIALISYDQKQFTDEGFASFAYWTLIGAYIVPGELNDTHTMVDAVVYDIASRKMLFRAPGISHIKGRSTPINLSEELRKDSVQGITDASKELLINLQKELKLFKQRVKDKPEQFKVTLKKGYRGAGSLNGFLMMLIIMIIGSKFIQPRSNKS